MIILRGKVRSGQKRGKALEFPTANINLHRKIEEGVYISHTKVEEKTYSSLTFIGAAKTFNEKKAKAESYIFSFNRNIYGKWVSIKLLKKLRGNKKFKSEKDLIVQMQKDKQIALEYFHA